MDMEMAANGRFMTYGNLTVVPATSSLVWLIFLSVPLSIYHVHARCWWFRLLLVQSDRGHCAGTSLIGGGLSSCCTMTERGPRASSSMIVVS